METSQIKENSFHEVVKRIVVSEPITISVIIPNYYNSRKENVGQLVIMLRAQTRKDMEILIVHEVSRRAERSMRALKQLSGNISWIYRIYSSA